MSWRFRQSFKLLPGLKLNLSKSGLSASIGGAPFTFNVGPRGSFATASVPGTGLSFRQHLGSGNRRLNESDPPSPGEFDVAPSPGLHPSYPPVESANANVREIRSASTEQLTSRGLEHLKRLILTAYEEHTQLENEVIAASAEASRTSSRFQAWDRGFLFKHLFKGAFSVRRAEAEIAKEKSAELAEQLRLTTITTQIYLGPSQNEHFFRMRDEFSVLTECGAIWDIKADRKVDQFHERSRATRAVSREKVSFSLDYCDLIQWDQKVPHMQNVNGGDLFLFPGFILYRASRVAFSVIDFHEVEVTAEAVQFHESGTVPGDSKVEGHTWAKANKDGSPDRRFADNHQIPIAVYGALTLKSPSGLWEEFQFSDPQKLARFVIAWKAFVAAFGSEISVEVHSGPEVFTEPVGAEIRFECNACNQPIGVNADAIGQEFLCPSCGATLVVPQT